MLNVTFQIHGDQITFKAEGHADYANKGEDIVCSSCSILTYTLGKVINDLDKMDAFYGHPTITVFTGDAEVSCIPREEYVQEVMNAYSFAEAGFLLLSRQYPRHVTLKMFSDCEQQIL